MKSNIGADETAEIFPRAKEPALSFKFNHIHAAAALTRRPHGWSVAFNIYPGIISARLIKAPVPLLPPLLPPSRGRFLRWTAIGSLRIRWRGLGIYRAWFATKLNRYTQSTSAFVPPLYPSVYPPPAAARSRTLTFVPSFNATAGLRVGRKIAPSPLATRFFDRLNFGLNTG